MVALSKAWVCGRTFAGIAFESRREHGFLSVVSVVCYQGEVSATGSSLIQRSPTKCGVPECDSEAQQGEAMTRDPVEAPQQELLLLLAEVATRTAMGGWQIV